jgi:hypothetical protein
MHSEICPGRRCRATRPITHPGGILRRAAEGTVITMRENIGRQLITVGFDSGEKLVLFAHELEVVSDASPSLH